jgi:prophage regulatory protein
MKAMIEAVADAERKQLEDAAKAALPTEYMSAPDLEYMSAPDLEKLTGTPASTWRYWAHIGSGPASFKLGRRRVWKRSVVLNWLESQEAASL